MLDLLLTGAEVHDGGGREAERVDVAVRDGRIEAVGRLGGARARRSLRLEGLALAPGFIDPHSHADLILVQEESAARDLLAGRVRQGITTALVGNCGMGAAPVTPRTEPVLRSLNGWMAPADVPWPWTDLAGYLDALEGRGLPLNVGALQAHGPLRLEAAGAGPGAVPPDGVRAMRRRVRAAFDAGAFGLSAGLIYPPGMYADTAELIELAREAAACDRVFACHVRGSSELLLPAVDELITVGRVAGCRVHHSHSEAVGREHWGKIEEVLARERRARAGGVRLSHDLFPYHAAATMMAALFPPRALAGGIEALIARLRVPAERDEIRRELEDAIPAWPPWTAGGWPHNLARAVGWGSIRVASVGGAPDVDGVLGHDLATLAERRGARPFDQVADLMIRHGGNVGQLLFGITGDEEDPSPMRLLISDPWGAFCTDAEELGRGLPHPAAYGAFPRILARWVRERRALALPEAIRRMTSLPAEIFGIRDRGRIAAGCWADLVAFDPAGVTDRADFSEPRRPPAGIPHVFVSGCAVVEDGRYLGTPAGAVLRR